VVYRKTVEKGYLYQFIPKIYEYLTKEKKIEYKGINLKTDYLINIIHELILKYYFHKDDTIDKEIKFNLSSLLLRKKYGHLYNYYINYLMSKEFLYMVSNYYAGTKTRTYRLNRIGLQNIMRVQVSDTILLKKNSKDYLKETFITFNKSPIPMDIRKKLADDLYDVDVDVDAALKYLVDLKANKEISHNKFWKNTISIENLGLQNIFFKFDEYGRMHTNYTVLKRHIRKNYLSIDGQDLEEVDITNSQPLFLAVLIKRELSPAKLVNPEISRYFELVKNGFIYEELINKCDIADRDEAKIMMYRVLFGINGNSAKYNKMFHSIFPTIYKFIKDFKNANNNYKTLSYALQNLESKFIFEGVVKHIMNTNPEIKLFTVHDSICFPLKYKDIVTNIFDYHQRNLLS